MLKRLAWFLFKSPQRKILGFKTLFTDLRGVIGWLFSSECSGEIWICTGLKNRTENMKRLVNSLNALTGNDKPGLSIADAGSADVEELKAWLQANWTGQLKFSHQAEEFNRARAFNRAIRQAPADLIFVCDADMTVPLDLMQLIRKKVSRKTIWFPVCQWQISEDKPDWKWYTAGTGLFAANKKWHGEQVFYDENKLGWGGEDWEHFFRCYRTGIMPLRSRCAGLYHHWHESLKPEDWQPLF